MNKAATLAGLKIRKEKLTIDLGYYQRKVTQITRHIEKLDTDIMATESSPEEEDSHG